MHEAGDEDPARAEVLARIRAANVAARGGTDVSAGAQEQDVPRDYRHLGMKSAGSNDVIALFRDRLLDYRARVVDAGPGGIPAAVQSVLEGIAGPVLAPPGLPEGWCPGAVIDDESWSGADLDRFAAVVTGCAAACAETGTIVLDGSPDQGRRAITLVPDVHICVVRAEQVVETVPELMAQLAPARPTTFVSGPSATSDIELQRVEGVHGPRTLVVVLQH